MDTSGDAAPFLQGVGQASWRRACWYYCIAVAATLGYILGLLAELLLNPFTFFDRGSKQRRHLDTQQPLPGAKHGFLRANGIKLHAVSLTRQPDNAGSDKPLLLFLHGFPEFWYSWRHLLKHFSADYDAVAIDMRGYGLSDKPSGVHEYDLDVLAADVAGAVRALGHERCILCGHDWGGGVAWVVAGLYPGLVDRLVIMAGPHPGLVRRNAGWTQLLKSLYILAFQAPIIPEAMFMHSRCKLFDKLYAAGGAMGPLTPGACTKADIEWYKHAFARPGAATATLNYYRALLPLFTYAPLPRVWTALTRMLRMPCLVMMADKDGALEPRLMDNLHKVAPVSELHILHECSHWIPMDAPAQAAMLMRKFLHKHPPTPPARPPQ